MRTASAFLALVALVRATTAENVVAPSTFIVELKARSHAPRLAARAAASSPPGFSVVQHFDHDLFPGVVVECQQANCSPESIRRWIDADTTESSVAEVYPSHPLSIPSTIEGESYSDDATAANYSVHGLTGVDKLHSQGILGEGAVVAIVDSGIQYTHPALGGCLGPNCTVIGGYDLVGDSWPTGDPVPDNDPMDRYGHGTHVAGIIAGQSDRFVGVAPKAKLMSFKVFGTGGYSNEGMVMSGFLKAFDSGADIISASVGETNGFTSNALAVLASRMVDQGVLVFFAGGNSGADGPFAMANGASGRNLITVASSDPGIFPAQAFNADFVLQGNTNKTRLAYIPQTTGYFPSSILGWPIRPVSLNISVTDDACSPLPDDTASFNNTIALIRLGGCLMTYKHTNVAKFGAQYVLFYSDTGVYTTPYSSNTTGKVAIIDKAAGEAIVNTIIAGGNVSASFDIETDNYVGLYNAGGGRPALYSSWGTTWDLTLKPDVSGPGTKILSTYPTDAYRVLSGTSMATPYLAGVAALWVGKFGGRSKNAADPAWAQRLAARITSTARAVPWADWSSSPKDYGFWASPAQVGAGLVDARSVLAYTTQIGFDGRKMELNDTARFHDTHCVDITNNGADPVTYSFSLQDAGGFESYTPLDGDVPRTFVPTIKIYGDINPIKIVPPVVLPPDLTVEPGQTRSVNISFSPPQGANASALPLYSGKVLISGSNGEELGVPYLGAACDIKKTLRWMWDYGSNTPYMTSMTNDIFLNKKANFTFNLTRASQDFPKLTISLVYGSEEIRWDIFDSSYTEADWAYPPVPGEKGFVGSATRWTGTSWAFTPGQDSEDDVVPFPLYDTPRQVVSQHYWLGRYANGSHVVPGTYKFRIAALRPFGDRTVASDWDVWQTPDITVLPLV